ncbi:MAG TPA: SRPBCC family protein [Puia sp.]|nr:SRPBCC family protein [Puia sp.]
MNTLLIILSILGILILLLLVVAFFAKEEYAIEKEVTIARPRQDVFGYVKLLRHQNEYNKWVMMDPDAKKEYRGTDGTPGFVATWDSANKNVGKGEQEIKKLTEGERIDLEIRFERPFKGVSFAYMTTRSLAQDQTRLSWVFSGTRNFPMRIFHVLLNLKKMLGKDMETSLSNLRAILEK